MNRDINEAIDAVIEQFQKTELTESFNEQTQFNLIQGLKIAQYLVEEVSETNTQEIAYEKFEELVKLYKEILPQEEFEEILNKQLEEV